MKKATAIILLALFAFNFFGYRLFISLLEENASTSLQHKLDLQQYSNDNLIEVKVPVNLPYLSNWSKFENYQGETEIDGQHYKYVKRKLVNDTLILLCIANETKNQLRSAQSDYFKQVNDLQGNTKKNSPAKDHLSKNQVNDYLLREFSFVIEPDNAIKLHYSRYLDQLSFSYRLVAEHPPES